MSSYHMESELQDAVSREETKRKRQKQRETGMSECDYFLEECCCGAKGASCCPSFMSCCSCCEEAAANGSNQGGEDEGGANGGNGGRDNCAFVQLLLYIVFPSFAIVDFLLGVAAKTFGWYDQSLGNIVCDNSVTACAVWIALAIVGFVLATATVVNAVCKCIKRRNRGRRQRAARKRREDARSQPPPPPPPPSFSVPAAFLSPADVGSALVTVVVEGQNKDELK